MAEAERWIKLHVKTLDNEVFQTDPTAWRVFEYCLLKAYPKGKFTTGRKRIAADVGKNENTVYKALLRLSVTGMVTQESNNRFTVITICNWSDYQSVGKNESNSSGNNGVTTQQQRGNTINKKNKKENKNNTTQAPGKSSVLFLDEEACKSVAEQYSVPFGEVRKVREELVLYVRSTGKRYADYYATLQGWVRRKKDEGKIRPADAPEKHQESPY